MISMITAVAGAVTAILAAVTYAIYQIKKSANEDMERRRTELAASFERAKTEQEKLQNVEDQYNHRAE